MFGKLLLAGVAVSALATVGLTASNAQAGSFGFDLSVHRGRSYHGVRHGDFHRHHHHYQVYYRDCWHEPWRCYGHYDCSPEAYRVADYLRFRGYHVRVGYD
jgi:hypothetical protein